MITAHELASRAVLCGGGYLTHKEAAHILRWVYCVFNAEDEDYQNIPIDAVAMSLAGETHLLEIKRELTFDETWHIARLVHPYSAVEGKGSDG